MKNQMRLSTVIVTALTSILPLPAIAGPCTDQIAEIGRNLSNSPALGPATTGALAGSGPGSVKKTDEGDVTGTIGTSASGQVGGTGGTKELNAAAGQVATSADDVRRQQEGLPTAAQTAANASASSIETKPTTGTAADTNNHLSEAKMALQKAIDLDQKGDPSCSDSISNARRLMSQ